MSALQAPATEIFHSAWDRHHQPSSSSSPSQIQTRASPQARDVSSLHPVFFTGRLRRSAPTTRNAVAPASSLVHPVAHGYVYHDERLMRRSKGPMLDISIESGI
ncbi:hypothetical protein F4823DRAFT_562255 [Ustulina deusta]|nr:hypothetical protein F4823DRAFT_562255 [Ustulina deusta]